MKLDRLKQLAGLTEVDQAPALDAKTALDMAYQECLKMEAHYHKRGEKEKEQAASACAESVRQLRDYRT